MTSVLSVLSEQYVQFIINVLPSHLYHRVLLHQSRCSHGLCHPYCHIIRIISSSDILCLAESSATSTSSRFSAPVALARHLRRRIVFDVCRALWCMFHISLVQFLRRSWCRRHQIWAPSLTKAHIQVFGDSHGTGSYFLIYSPSVFSTSNVSSASDIFFISYATINSYFKNSILLCSISYSHDLTAMQSLPSILSTFCHCTLFRSTVLRSILRTRIPTPAQSRTPGIPRFNTPTLTHPHTLSSSLSVLLPSFAFAFRRLYPS